MKVEKDFNSILVCVLYFVLGIVFLAATDELLKTLNYILVSICAFIGVMQFIGFFISGKYKDGNSSDLLLAIVFIWVSLILYVYYGFMINILPILFSLYLFVMACDMFFKYIKLRELKDNGKFRYLILMLVSIVVGMLLIFNPGSMIITYLKITGAYLVLVSILYGVDYFRVFKVIGK